MGPIEQEAHTVEPDVDHLPWYHPDHLMHHLPWASLAIIATAVFGWLGLKYKHRRKTK